MVKKSDAIKIYKIAESGNTAGLPVFPAARMCLVLRSSTAPIDIKLGFARLR